jgi:hypothetical protein
LVRCVAPLSWPLGDDALVPVGSVPILPHRLHRGARRVVHRRGRPPALGSLRSLAHQGRGDAVIDDR